MPEHADASDAAAEAPQPPWRTRPRPRAAGPPLSQRQIVTVALELVDRSGVDAVNMRTIAQALRTGPASIYRHVATKEELLELTLDRVLAEVRVPEPDADDWRGPLRDLAYEIHTVLLAHGDIARVAMLGRPVGGHAVRVAEGLLAILRTAGFDAEVCAWAMDRLSLYVTADAATRDAHRHAGSPDSTDMWEQVATYYRSLPAHRFPHTTALLDTLFTGDADERFARGLDLFLDGLAARAPGRS